MSDIVDRYSDKTLEDLAVSLRDEAQRRSIPKCEIKCVYDHLMNNQPIQNHAQLHSSILSLKVLSNFAADVPENAAFLVLMIQDSIPIVPFNIVQFLNKDNDVKEISLFTNIQLILLNNILTTSKEAFSKEVCKLVLDRIFNLFTFCESLSIDVDIDSIIEILDEFESIMGKISISKFSILRDLCRCINDSARADGNGDLIVSSSKVCLKYSSNLDFSDVSAAEKESFFLELYKDLRSTDNEQILLNVSYELKMGSESFFQRLLTLFFDSNGELQMSKHIPMALIILANEITSENIMEIFLEKVSVEKLIETYFTQIYPLLSLQLPWELQSIVLFNKLPIGRIEISDVTLASYMSKMSSLIRYTTLQIRLDVVSLQVVFLGKILAQTKEIEQRKSILTFLSDVKLSNEYDSFPAGFKQTLNQVYFPSLNFHKGSPEEMGDILSVSLIEAREILQKSIADQTGVQIKYLIELSQILGFYVQIYGQEGWFQNCFNILEESVEGARKQLDRKNKEQSKYEHVAWQVLEDNIKYTDVLLKQDSGIE
ncbi:hypothetical protein PMKS-001033 [Pichia membranifaciens]|uniref:DNA mismatch repair protein HSM3 n=1 Tax=Pichia membranifaciens TaxID=4926 RepID=A0A1Q2YDG3_9ASCO|nr:hypothetical protein PMKS-001033 [Pichia membranifaciens]